MADRRRLSKELHEHSWHPDYGWQILRRTRSYQDAVNEFLEEATYYDDKMALALYALYSEQDESFNERDFEVELDPTRFQTLRDYISDTEDYDLISRDRLNIDVGWRPGCSVSLSLTGFVSDTLTT